MHTPDVPSPDDPRPELDDQLRAFMPIILGAAVVCLLMFLFVTPSFEATDSMGAKSTRPGAERATTRPENK
jgi:hypothetical protein